MIGEEHEPAPRGIALLLADAAAGVEIGPPPVQTIVRGGRRRRARRRALAAATALVIAGSVGASLATGALTDGNRKSQVAEQPQEGVRQPAPLPLRATLATGRTDGKQWQITVDVWAPPKTAAQAAQLADAMNGGEYLDVDRGGAGDRGLIGTGWYFVRVDIGGRNSFALDGPIPDGKGLRQSLEARPARLGPRGSDWVVVGKASPDTRRVVCTWDDGTSTELPRSALRPVGGDGVLWFAAEVPRGRAFASADARY
ncbi:hypothetical protein [Streptomyces sp. NBC_00370]|uniref:hypothetical protein n=1 Tax=Streptomyces sp. NBC_00370 TaxID=2975728 RepID=UPI002E259657